MDELNTVGCMMLAQSDISIKLALTNKNQLVAMCEQGPVFVELDELNREIGRKSGLLPVPKPEANSVVKAIIRNSETKEITTGIPLVAVDETDIDWRFLSDNCCLDTSWDVVFWEYIEQD